MGVILRIRFGIATEAREYNSIASTFRFIAGQHRILADCRLT